MKKTKIFYADDDLDDIEIFVEAVTRMIDNGTADIDIEVFQDGPSLLSAIRTTKKHDQNSIIFLDINMPGKDGFQILQEIRLDAVLNKKPVIMYSTSSDANTVNTSREAGASAYVVKPSDFHTLTAIIKKVTDIDWTIYTSDSKNFILGHKYA